MTDGRYGAAEDARAALESVHGVRSAASRRMFSRAPWFSPVLSGVLGGCTMAWAAPDFGTYVAIVAALFIGLIVATQLARRLIGAWPRWRRDDAALLWGGFIAIHFAGTLVAAVGRQEAPLAAPALAGAAETVALVLFFGAMGRIWRESDSKLEAGDDGD